ncbi:hypothetical protein JCM18899A_37600 [Nocardioides sp. AN3]
MNVTTPELTPAPSPGRRRPPLLVGAAVVAVLVLVAVAVGVVAWTHRGPDRAPYTDASATGRLTLCDANRHAVTSGSVKGGPLAAAVVGASPVGRTEGTTATLFAYQPRQGAETTEWTGLALTAPGAVSATTPTLALPAGSITLAQFLGGYPASWDGWVQLRLLVSTPDDGTSATYDAVDLKVEGDRWQAAEPGAASCPS